VRRPRSTWPDSPTMFAARSRPSSPGPGRPARRRRSPTPRRPTRRGCESWVEK
jgi:hypothetical protein